MFLEVKKISWCALGKTLSGRWCPLCSVLVKPHLEYWLLALGAPGQDMNFLGQVQERVTKTAKRLQRLPWAKADRVGTLQPEEKFWQRKVHECPMGGLKNGVISCLRIAMFSQERTRGNGCKMIPMEFHMNTEQLFVCFLFCCKGSQTPKHCL